MVKLQEIPSDLVDWERDCNQSFVVCRFPTFWKLMAASINFFSALGSLGREAGSLGLPGSPEEALCWGRRGRGGGREGRGGGHRGGATRRSIKKRDAKWKKKNNGFFSLQKKVGNWIFVRNFSFFPPPFRRRRRRRVEKSPQQVLLWVAAPPKWSQFWRCLVEGRRRRRRRRMKRLPHTFDAFCLRVRWFPVKKKFWCVCVCKKTSGFYVCT